MSAAGFDFGFGGAAKQAAGSPGETWFDPAPAADGKPSPAGAAAAAAAAAARSPLRSIQQAPPAAPKPSNILTSWGDAPRSGFKRVHAGAAPGPAVAAVRLPASKPPTMPPKPARAAPPAPPAAAAAAPSPRARAATPPPSPREGPVVTRALSRAMGLELTPPLMDKTERRVMARWAGLYLCCILVAIRCASNAGVDPFKTHVSIGKGL
jgi:hypothetical protein